MLFVLHNKTNIPFHFDLQSDARIPLLPYSTQIPPTVQNKTQMKMGLIKRQSFGMPAKKFLSLYTMGTSSGFLSKRMARTSALKEPEFDCKCTQKHKIIFLSNRTKISLDIKIKN